MPEQPPTSRPSGLGYVFGAVALGLAAMLGIVVVSVLRPADDNAAIIGAIIALATPTAAALVAFAVRDVHLQVNSRMDELLLASNMAARAEGTAAGKAAGREAAESRQDIIADRQTKE